MGLDKKLSQLMDCPLPTKHMYQGHCHLIFNTHVHILQFKYILKNAQSLTYMLFIQARGTVGFIFNEINKWKFMQFPVMNLSGFVYD